MIETSQIEITLDANLHDDGVDIKISLLSPLSLDTVSTFDLDPAASKYSIGGNGFNDGDFLSGTVTPSTMPIPETATSIWIVSILSVGFIVHRRSHDAQSQT